MMHPHIPCLRANGRCSWRGGAARHALAAISAQAIRDLPAAEAPPERRVAVPVTEALHSDASRSCRPCGAGRPARRPRRRRRRRCCARWRRSTRALPASPPTPTMSSRSGGVPQRMQFTPWVGGALLRVGAIWAASLTCRLVAPATQRRGSAAIAPAETGLSRTFMDLRADDRRHVAPQGVQAGQEAVVLQPVRSDAAAAGRLQDADRGGGHVQRPPEPAGGPAGALDRCR